MICQDISNDGIYTVKSFFNVSLWKANIQCNLLEMKTELNIGMFYQDKQLLNFLDNI